MMIIVTKKRVYKINHRRLLKHLFYMFAILYLILAFLYVGSLDYEILMNK